MCFNHFYVYSLRLVIAMILVIAFGGHNAKLQPLQNNPPCPGGSLSFPYLNEYIVNGTLRGVATGDFNRDGKADVVLGVDRTYSSSSQVSPVGGLMLYLGDGTGYLEPFSEVRTVGSTPSNLSADDFNGDGKLDVFGLNGGQSYGVWLGNGDGTFGNQISQMIESIEYEYVIADFNGDQKKDVALAGSGQLELTLLLGLGNGQFQASKVASPVRVQSLAAADFDNDGKQDLALCGLSQPNLAILFNNGNNGFKAPVTIENFSGYTSVAATDLNTDNRPDLVVGTTSEAFWLANNGSGGFLPAKRLVGFAGPKFLTRDFNRDSKPDLLGYDSRSFKLGLGAGNGTLTTVSQFVGQTNVLQRAVVDLNSDNYLDLIEPNYNSQTRDNRLSIIFGGPSGFLAPQRYLNSSLFAQMLGTTDFNADNKPDFFFGSPIGSPTIAAINNGDGKFTQVNLNRTLYAASVIAADFNGDTKNDIAAATNEGFESPAVISLFSGNGNGTFANTNSQPYPLSGTAAAMVSADFNGDNRTDIAAAIPGKSEINLLLNNGQGGFAPYQAFTVGLEPRSIAAGDFSHDGKPDLVVANRNSVTLSLLVNNGQGVFQHRFVGIGANPREIKLADLNGDNFSDLIVLLSNAPSMVIMLGNQAGNFDAPKTVNVGTLGNTLALSDFNLDGKVDIAVSRFAAQFQSETLDRVAIFLGNGSGGFQLRGEMPIEGAGALATGDFTADGFPDLAALSVRNDGIWLSQTQCRTASAPIQLSVSAASYRKSQLAADSIATVYGTSLSEQTLIANTIPLPTTLGGVSLRVRDSLGNERLAPLFFVSPFQINYLVPTSTIAGTATVTVLKNGAAAGNHSIQVAAVAPGIFSANANGTGVGAGVALRVKPNGAQSLEPISIYQANTGQFVPVEIDLGVNPVALLDKVYIALFGTGWRGRTRIENVKVLVAGQEVETLYASSQGGYAGLDQLNFLMPNAGIPRGLVDVQVLVDGKSSNVIYLLTR